MLALSMTTAACASLPQASSEMALGAAAAPPPGYVAFCQRQPDECGPDAKALSVAANEPAPSATAVASISAPAPDAPNVLRLVFDRDTQPRVVQADMAAPPPVGVRYDWSAVFASLNTPPQAAPVQPAPEPVAPAAEPQRGARTTPLRPETWALIRKVNEQINRAIARQDDSITYGEAEIWNLPLEAGLKGGDCEDYVLEKRRALIKAGLPQEALSIAVVNTLAGESHAVLLVNTDKGEYVLDNLTPWVLPWTETSYVWRERQVAGSSSLWAFAAAAIGPSLAPSRLASLR